MRISVYGTGLRLGSFVLIGQRGTEGHNVDLKIAFLKNRITWNGKWDILAIPAPEHSSGS